MRPICCHFCQDQSDWLLSCQHNDQLYCCKGCAEPCANEGCLGSCKEDAIVCDDCHGSFCNDCMRFCKNCNRKICIDCEDLEDRHTCPTCKLACCQVCIEGHCKLHRDANLVYGTLALKLNGSILQSLSANLNFYYFGNPEEDDSSYSSQDDDWDSFL
jgi:hypothetical protein